MADEKPGAGETTQVTIDTSKPAVVVDPKRPAWLPEKFKSPEDFAAAYKELETKQGKPAATDPATATIDGSKVDMPALAKEFTDNGGKLKPETLKLLEGKGITAAAVDAYVTGLQAKAGALRSTLVTTAGGEDKLKAVYEWAGANLAKEEIAAYNAQVNSGNGESAKLALTGIMAKYTAANGDEPNLVRGEEAAGTEEAGYASDAEVVKAMSDPRYAVDEAYRQKVAKKMGNTEMFSLRY